MSVVSSTIDNNVARDEGGGLYVATGSFETSLTRTLIEGNQAGARGGGIHFAGGTKVRLNSSVIRRNTPGNCSPPDTIAGCAAAGSGRGVGPTGAVGPTGEKLTQYLSIVDHYDDFGKGVIDTTHLIYYVSFITFGLFLTAKSVDSERWRG